MMKSTRALSDTELAAFQRDGYFVVKSLASEAECDVMQRVAARHLEQRLAPVEYEVDVQYPGSPRTVNDEGGQTVRRLLHAYARDSAFRDWATSEQIKAYLARCFGTEAVMLSQCHHNCVMTKQPGYSSATLWHKDIRYWSFDHQNLISTWLALGDEVISNGCLRVLPGTHLMEIEPGRFDAALFLRTDIAENEQLIATARTVELQRGDVLLFDSRLFHAAGQNLTASIKYSVVFTYHEASNFPIEGTRSARFPGISL